MCCHEPDCSLPEPPDQTPSAASTLGDAGPLSEMASAAHPTSILHLYTYSLPPPLRKRNIKKLQQAKVPWALRKQPMARGEGLLVTLSTCPCPRPRARVRELYRVHVQVCPQGPRPEVGPRSSLNILLCSPAFYPAPSTDYCDPPPSPLLPRKVVACWLIAPRFDVHGKGN